MNGVKHLIQCHCILPQYKNRKDPVFHKFVAFSIVDNSDNVIHKFSKCNNCGVIHKIIDLFKSEVVHGVDESSAILTIEDLKRSLTLDLVSILETHDCDFATWEQAKFMYENKIWNNPIILTSEDIGDSSQFKILTLLDGNRVKIETKIRNDTIEI